MWNGGIGRFASRGSVIIASRSGATKGANARILDVTSASALSGEMSPCKPPGQLALVTIEDLHS
jgi:hypothetical protein